MARIVMFTCPHCGAFASDEDVLCPQCGLALDDVTETETGDATTDPPAAGAGAGRRWMYVIGALGALLGTLYGLVGLAALPARGISHVAGRLVGAVLIGAIVGVLLGLVIDYCTQPADADESDPSGAE